MESNRENRGAEDLGLDDSDLTAADGIIRAKKIKDQKKQLVPSDDLKVVKGDFTFPHRLIYMDKCTHLKYPSRYNIIFHKSHALNIIKGHTSQKFR